MNEEKFYLLIDKMGSRTLILNSSHIVGNGNNTLTYQFPSGQATFVEGDKIALSQASIDYSWDSLSNSNNGLTYTWTNGSVVNVNPPPGFYTLSQLNSYLQSIMFSNQHYLVDNNGQNVYYLTLEENLSYYAIQFNAYLVPASLPSGWTLPVGAAWSLPGTARTAQITVGTLSTVLGFTAGTYPAAPSATVFAQLSQRTPVISPITSVVVTCDLVSNKLANPTSLIYAFSPNVTYASQIRVEPNTPIFNSILPGQYASLTIRLYDQDLRPLVLKDSSIVILLEIMSSV